MKNIKILSALSANFYLAGFLTLSLSSVAMAGSSKTADEDGDGLPDYIEIQLGSEPYLSDTDGDGIPDMREVGNTSKPLDSDNDGRLDVVDLDDDNDGIPTIFEGTGDTDKDGILNYLDLDSDGDGLPDSDEVKLTYQDRDHDYIDDLFDSDSRRLPDENGDGIIDKYTFHDSDKDGKIDLLDSDGNTSIISKKPKKKAPVKIAKVQKPPKEVIKLSSIQPPEAIKHAVSYTAAKKKTKGKIYGGAGYFYCANNGKIVSGIKRFMVTPPEEVTLVSDARNGTYEWKTRETGIYAIQFQLPAGVSIVRGLAKGRKKIKEGDPAPVILGGGQNGSKKGYLNKPANGMQNWFTSFDIQQGAPEFLNNNIPLQGGVCNEA